jgi:hypothetical protein
MRQQWLIGMLENKILTDTQIDSGLAAARKSTSQFLPSIGQFIEWCNSAGKEKYPPLEICMTELIQFVKNGRRDTYNLSPFMYHTVTRNLDLYNYRLLEREYDRVKAFEVAYKATLFQLETGHELATPPAPETLLESKADTKAPVDIKKGSEVLGSLLSMFDEPPPSKPMTEAEIKDNERLERIKLK